MFWEIKKITLLTVTVLFLFEFFNLILDAHIYKKDKSILKVKAFYKNINCCVMFKGSRYFFGSENVNFVALVFLRILIFQFPFYWNIYTHLKSLISESLHFHIVVKTYIGQIIPKYINVWIFPELAFMLFSIKYSTIWPCLFSVHSSIHEICFQNVKKNQNYNIQRISSRSYSLTYSLSWLT